MPHGVTNSDLTAIPLDFIQAAADTAISDSLENICSIPIDMRGSISHSLRVSGSYPKYKRNCTQKWYRIPSEG